MTAQEMKANSVKKLRSQLKMDLATFLRLCEQVSRFSRPILDTTDVGIDNPNVYAVALNLQHVYTCLETAFERVARQLDGDVPTGSDGHRQLLEQMVLSIEGVRPALVSLHLKDKLDRLRQFRHIVRHGYEYELDWAQMVPLVESLPEICDQIQKDFVKFEEFLTEMAESLGKES